MPNPVEMFNSPSVAKGSPARMACEAAAHDTAEHAAAVIEDMLLAARIEHFAAIGGDLARKYLLGEHCRITPKQIAGLCRRMPPFIAAKLKELEAGSTKIDSNPTGAFDTNGWGELRVRLPKFRSSLQHYARQCESGDTAGDLSLEERAALKIAAGAIVLECDALLDRLRTFTPVGDGIRRNRLPPPERALDWSKARTKLAQVLGVLRKTNRDLRSIHWRAEWIPKRADFEIVTWDVQAMRSAAETMLTLLGRCSLTFTLLTALVRASL